MMSISDDDLPNVRRRLLDKQILFYVLLFSGHITGCSQFLMGKMDFEPL